jgi:hypothetical protein
MIAGVVFGAIVIVWQLVPLFFVKPLEVTWTDEATYFYGNYTAEIFTAVGGAVETSVLWTKDFAEEIANQTDLIVHVIDVRVGMALVWWELSQDEYAWPKGNRLFSGRWTWDRDGKYRDPPPQACYDRLKEAEQMAIDKFNFPDDWLPVDWSFEAVRYYWNPGEWWYNVSDQPDMKDILRREANYTGEFRGEEFRAMFVNATVKAEEIASADDGIVDLEDLREAIAIVLQQQYPDRYPTLADAQSRLEELEATVGLTTGT